MRIPARLGFAAVLLAVPAALADRGSIPSRPHVRIFEPAQRSIIAWDGRTEILLLSTDMSASEETAILEILPLPAEPKVAKGEIESFRVANRLIERHLPRRREHPRSKDGTKGGGGEPEPAAEITFHERIGAHDISVAEVKDAAGFVDWVGRFVAEKNVPIVVSEAYRGLIEAYLRDGFAWFVLDLVDLKTESRTLDPIQYTFATPSLFYPLRISTLEEGNTDVRIIVLTPRLLAKFTGLETERVRVEHKPFQVAPDELDAISKDMGALLKDTRPYLRIWRCEGTLASFTKDLIVKE